jgi:hypothetical protein
VAGHREAGTRIPDNPPRAPAVSSKYPNFPGLIRTRRPFSRGARAHPMRHHATPCALRLTPCDDVHFCPCSLWFAQFARLKRRKNASPCTGPLRATSLAGDPPMTTPFRVGFCGGENCRQPCSSRRSADRCQGQVGPGAIRQGLTGRHGIQRGASPSPGSPAADGHPNPLLQIEVGEQFARPSVLPADSSPRPKILPRFNRADVGKALGPLTAC